MKTIVVFGLWTGLDEVIVLLGGSLYFELLGIMERKYYADVAAELLADAIPTAVFALGYYLLSLFWRSRASSSSTR